MRGMCYGLFCFFLPWTAASIARRRCGQGPDDQIPLLRQTSAHDALRQRFRQITARTTWYLVNEVEWQEMLLFLFLSLGLTDQKVAWYITRASHGLELPCRPSNYRTCNSASAFSRNNHVTVLSRWHVGAGPHSHARNPTAVIQS